MILLLKLTSTNKISNVFSIKFINFYQYCIQNFDCLKKYGTIFDFDSF